MKTKISAKIVADSVSPQGHRITTMELVFPRFLLAELNTHRVFSKNSASSRAIPFKKMVKMVQNDPFIPIVWQKDHKGMQGTEYLKEYGEIGEINYVARATRNWLIARDYAVKQASYLNSDECSVTKQLCNRLLEPFMWHKVLLTATEFDNFFELRCPSYEINSNAFGTSIFKSRKSAGEYCKMNGIEPPHSQLEWLKANKGQAEIHMMELAECMYDAYNENTPDKLKAGDWHIPYEQELLSLVGNKAVMYEDIIKASTGLCARTSYLTVGDDKSPSIETLIGIHDKMAEAVPFHASPFEHCARAMSDVEHYSSIRTSNYPVHIPKTKEDIENYGGIVNKELHPHHIEYGKGIDQSMYGWCRNYQGFIQYRYLLENK